MGPGRRFWVFLAAVGFSFLARPVAGNALPNGDCLACHGEPSFKGFVDAKRFEASVHGNLFCTTCHADVTGIPHGIPLKSVAQVNIPTACGFCHSEVQVAYQAGIHGQAVAAGKRHAPVCTDCHGDHYIARVATEASKVFPSHIPETCGACHAAERIITRYRLPSHAVETYMESYHGLALQLGSVTAANCASCHGAHDILPSADPRSSVHPDSLPKTCGKCHAGVSAQVAKGQIHSGTRPGLEPLAVSWVRRIYLALIFVVVGGMLVHNLLDFRRKLKLHLKEDGQGAPVLQRMDLNERLQHAVLALVFVTLAYSGFALKFPQAWWSSPFVGRVDWRGFAHKAAALIFVALAIYHFWFVRFTPRGRGHLAALRPRRRDFIQPFQMLAFYLGRGARPVFARYSYVEKAEYWALVWGSIVMAATGALMTWEGWTLKVFPKWLFDLVTAIHYYEAILACLAIVVWHFYFTVFDPEVYPMDRSWITGRSPKEVAKG